MSVNMTPGFRRRKFEWLLLAVWLMSLDARAFINGNLECNVTRLNPDGYVFQAGSEIRVSFSGNCTVKRTFPKGAATNLQMGHIIGINPSLEVMDFYNSSYMLQMPLGSYGTSCLGGPCKRLAVGSNISYTYAIYGRAPSTPGRRTALMTLGVTSWGYPNYAEWIHSNTFIYDVSAVSCTLSTPSAISLDFGMVSNTSIGGRIQSTSVSVNCPSAVTAKVTLTPSQPVVNENNGVSRTTLAGLNMQAVWSDTGNPVVFSNTRTIYMNAGANNVNLMFRPQVVSGQSPTGAFQSQYTLNISYQ